MVTMDSTAVILTAHQRHKGGCLCGWDELGKSHPEHQAAMLREAGLLAADSLEASLILRMAVAMGEEGIGPVDPTPRDDAIVAEAWRMASHLLTDWQRQEYGHLKG